LKAGGLAALLFGGVGTAGADPQGQIGTGSDPLQAVYTEELTLADSPYDGTNDETVTTFAGDGLSIASDTLSAALGNGLGFDGSQQIEIPGSAIGSTELGDGAVTTTELGSDAVTSTELADGTVTASDLATLVGTPVTAGGDLDMGATGAVELNTDDMGSSVYDRPSQGHLFFGMAGDDGAILSGQAGSNGTNDGEFVIRTQDDGTEEIKLQQHNSAGDYPPTTRLRIDETGHTRIDKDLRTESNTVIWDSSNSEIPTARLNPDDFAGKYLSGSGTTLDFDGAAEWKGGGSNTASSTYATVGGGYGNTASSGNATVGGGYGNTAGRKATVGGGISNTASGVNATVGGGDSNTASGSEATVGGGRNNTAGGSYATVPGGYGNTADGYASFAAGFGNSIGSGQNNCFVFGQGVDLVEDAGEESGDGRRKLIVFSPGDGEFTGDMGGEASNEVLSDAPIYAPLNDTSSRTLKTNIETVDARSILTKVRNIEISKWEFIDIDTGRHIGPMAEDFHDAFAVGNDEKSIASVDADGVALAAIQGLSEQVDEKDDRIDALEAENADIRAENEALRERVAAIEAHVGLGDAGEEVVADD
jgi:hypothetical protein